MLERTPAQEYIDKSLDFHKKNLRITAIAWAHHALRIDPNTWETHRLLHDTYSAEQVYDEALYHLNNCYQLISKDAEYYSNRGVIYQNQDRTAEAISDYNKACELDPNNDVPYKNLGKLIAGKDPDELFNLIKTLPNEEQLILLEPCTSDLKKQMTILEPNVAIKRPRKKPNLIRTCLWKNNWLSSFSIDELDQHVLNLKAIPKTDKENVTSDTPNTMTSEEYIARARSLFNDNQYAAAISSCNHAIRLKPDDAIRLKPDACAYNLLGDIYYHAEIYDQLAGEYDEALYNYDQAIEIDDKPEQAYAYYKRGIVYQWMWNKVKEVATTKQAFGFASKAIADFKQVKKLAYESDERFDWEKINKDIPAMREEVRKKIKSNSNSSGGFCFYAHNDDKEDQYERDNNKEVDALIAARYKDRK